MTHYKIICISYRSAQNLKDVNIILSSYQITIILYNYTWLYNYTIIQSGTILKIDLTSILDSGLAYTEIIIPRESLYFASPRYRKLHLPTHVTNLRVVLRDFTRSQTTTELLRNSKNWAHFTVRLQHHSSLEIIKRNNLNTE